MDSSTSCDRSMLTGEEEDPKPEYCLAEFPINYRLFEHIRTVKPDPTKSDQSRSSMRNERSDVYLYGHPDGPKKRFRSPHDFFSHLLWLVKDDGYLADKKAEAQRMETKKLANHKLVGQRSLYKKEEDLSHDSCTCKLCVPEELIKNSETFMEDHKAKCPDCCPKEIPQVNVPMAQKRVVPKLEKASEERKAIKVNHNASMGKMIPPKRSASVSQESTQQVVPGSMASLVASQITIAPTPSMSSLVAPPLGPSPLTPPKNHEQDVDAQCNMFLLRPGEVVWFHRGGNMHGLSVVTKRQLFVHQRRLEYTLQPLSHPLANPYPSLIGISSESLLRPWLGWSAPTATHKKLNECLFPYDSINWKAVINKAYGEGDAEIDGSVFAAKFIDGSYTLFEPSKLPNSPDISYNGLFLGCEKIWTGEAIRLRVGSGRDIMILHHIIEKRSNGQPGDVYVVGDIYTFETVPSTVAATKNPFLPVRVQEDLDYRNRSTISHKSQVSYWRLLQAGARLSLADVKGRWYESRVLLPIITGQAQFIASVGKGEIADVGDMLNMRGLSTGLKDLVGLRRNTRIEALGRSIPKDTSIEGTFTNASQPTAFQIDPALTAAQINVPNTQVLDMEMDPPLPVTNNLSMFEGVDDALEMDYYRDVDGSMDHNEQY